MPVGDTHSTVTSREWRRLTASGKEDVYKRQGLETRQRLVDLLGENIAAFCRGEPRNVIV